MEEVDDPQGSSATFEEILSRLQAERRLDPAVVRTADYLVTASVLDEEKDILQEAKKKLKSENPRELYLSFIKDRITNLRVADKSNKYHFAKQINDVALMGLGIWQEDLGITSAGQDAFVISGEPDWDTITDRRIEI